MAHSISPPVGSVKQRSIHRSGGLFYVIEAGEWVGRPRKRPGAVLNSYRFTASFSKCHATQTSRYHRCGHSVLQRL